jgi:ribose transport system substrate-binding protein
MPSLPVSYRPSVGSARCLLCAGIVCLLIALLGCQPVTDRRKTVGVSLLTKEHMFYQNLQAAMEKGADRQFIKLIISSGEWDLARQQSQIENFIDQQVDAILVCPVNSEAIGPAIAKANAAGIPVFTADIRAKSGKVVSHVASDNFKGGRLAGEFLARALRGSGKVAVIDQPVIESVAQRVLGFRDAIDEHAGLEIVATVKGEGMRDSARQAAAELLRRFPDVQGIFAINDPTALGIVDALQKANRSDVTVVGFDGDPEALALLATGSPLKAIVLQHPTDIGLMVIDVIHRHLSGEAVPESIAIGVSLREAKP